MFSVICIYNNPDTLGSWLLPELCNQKVKYEKIFIDNTNNRFSSAAEAFNSVVNLAHGDYLMFVHQDVKFEDTHWFEKAEYFMKRLEYAGVVGVAGISEEGETQVERGKNIIKWGNPPSIWGWSNAVYAPTVVQTVDECLFIVPKKVFSKLSFDNRVCDDWHLYAVDLCLEARKIGLTNYILPLSIWHKGTFTRIKGIIPTLLNLGHLPKPYYKTLKKLLMKYKNDFKWIYTTCGEWNTYQLLFTQRTISILREVLSKIRNTVSKRNLENYNLDILK